MAGILSTLGRGNQKKDPMRESAALTTVYLLEQNQKFERFMQQKVDDLESRVAAQQARLSTREEAEERELWAALEVGDEIDGLATERGPADEPEFEAEDILSEWNEPPPAPPDDEESLEHIAVAEPEAVPDYLALMMGGAATEPGGNVAVADEKQRDMREVDTARPLYFEPEGSAVPGVSPSDDEVHTSLPQDASDIGDENETSPAHTSGANPAAVEIGNDPWPDQYEAFQVAWPDGDEVDELWPDVEADGVELLVDQETVVEPEPTANEINQVESETTAEPGSAGRKTDDDPAGALDQADKDEAEPWESALPAGQKDEWS